MRDALPHQRLRRLARRLDAPDRQARRHGRHVGDRRRRGADRRRRGARRRRCSGVDRVVVVFLGDATTEEGVASESLNFAALKQLPVVFFCENNFYSVQSPLATRQPAAVAPPWAAGYGMPAVEVDGMNVLAVLRGGARGGRPRPAPAGVRRSSRRRSTGSARTAAPATTARPGTATTRSARPGRRCDPVQHVRGVPRGCRPARRCGRRADGGGISRRRSRRPSRLRSRARTRGE